MKLSWIFCAVLASAFAQTVSPSPASAEDSPLVWDAQNPESLKDWLGVYFKDTEGGRTQEDWLWVRKKQLVPANKGKSGYEVVPGSVDNYHLCAPMFKLTLKGKSDQKITVNLENRDQEVDGVVARFDAELSSQYRFCVQFKGEGSDTDYDHVRRLGSAFKIPASVEDKNVALLMRLLGGTSDTSKINGKYHRAIVVLQSAPRDQPPTRAEDSPLVWDTQKPESLKDWLGVNFKDTEGGRAQEDWLWVRKKQLVPANKGKSGYEVVPGSVDNYHLCAPMFKLTLTGKSDQKITVNLEGRDQEVDGVVARFDAELSSQYRFCVHFKGEGSDTDYDHVRRLGSAFKIPASVEDKNVALLMRLLGGTSDTSKINGKYHRAIVLLKSGSGGQPPARPGLPPELTQEERDWLTPKELKAYTDALDAATKAPTDQAKVDALKALHATSKSRSDKRRTDTGNPPLFLSPEDRKLLTKEELVKYYEEYDRQYTAPGDNAAIEAALRAITKKYYEIVYPPDRLSDRELAGLSPGEKAEFEKEMALAAKDQPTATTRNVVSMWRGFAKRKATGKNTYWDLFVLSDAALAPYGDETARAKIREKIRREGDPSKTPEENFKSRVNLAQRYYCTGQTIRSSIKPSDKSQKTIDLLRELAANPQADRVKIDGQADRAVAPNPDPLCSGNLFTREKQDALLGDQRPTNTAGFIAGDVKPPETPAPATPGKYNDIINAAKFGIWFGILGFFFGGPVGAVLFGVMGMGLSYFMGKVK